ncbi:T9SS type A sorting domain-containing protein [Empedobacter brevis]|uniref:T9SS type A sorting domain-containing protein n=1 Tax=Empedobacter brevis TaxID=247 RepID=UPI00333F0ACD
MKNSFTIILLLISNLLLSQQLDPTFANQGVLKSEVKNMSPYTKLVIKNNFITSDKSILNIGNYASTNYSNETTDLSLTFIKKYNNLGVLDTSYGNNGTFMVPNYRNIISGFGADDNYLFSSINTPDNSVILSLVNNRGRRWFMKVTDLGQYDTKFGDEGFLDYPLSLATNSPPYLIKLNDYFITIAHRNNKFYLHSYNYDGTPNINFGNNGLIISDYGDEYTDLIHLKVLYKNNKIYIYGSTNYQNIVYNFISCYNENGYIDTSFGINGFFLLERLNKANEDIYINEYTDFDIQDDGKILFIANSTKEGVYIPFAFRYKKNGSLDQNFGKEGNIIFSNPDSWYSMHASKIIQLPNKKILIGGYIIGSPDISGNGPSILCLNENGSIDSEFGGNMKSLTNSRNVQGVYLLPGDYSSIKQINLDNEENSIIISATTERKLWSYIYKLKYNMDMLFTIDNEVNNDKFNIFPNPIEQIATFSNNLNKKDIEYVVLDLNGRVIKKGNVKDKTIDFSKIKRGTYIIKLKDLEYKSIKVIKK